MLAILSPAKDMKVQTGIVHNDVAFTIPEFLPKSAALIAELKKLNKEALSELMKISEKLASLNYDRYRNWTREHSTENASRAILSFKGEAYRGLNAVDFDTDDLQYAQYVLRILSGLYGVIRPLDLIQPYRLEMGTRHSFKGKKNLYELWKTTISKAIDQAVEASPGDKVLVNVASNEYASAIDFKRLKSRVLTLSFNEEKNGKAQTVTVYAKKARGMLCHFMIKNRLESVDDLKAFDYEGYFFDQQRSSNDHFAFIR
jgi:hypothetical protein